MSKPSPASVLSLLALFVALGGTGWAAVQIPKASVGAPQLKKSSVTSVKVRNGALRLGDFKASERTKLRGAAGVRGAGGARGTRGEEGLGGEEGLEGVEGLQGDQGLQGVPGPTGVEQVVVRTTGFTFEVSTGLGETQSDAVQCHPGERVVGGGTDVSPSASFDNQPNTLVTSSRPSDATGLSPAGETTPSGWFAAARRNSDTFRQIVTVYVLCASAA